MKKFIIGLMLGVVALTMGASSLTTRMLPYTVLKSTADVAATPDTSLLANIAAYTINGRASTAIDLTDEYGAGADTYANAIEIIVTHSAAADADGTTSVLELHGSVDNGPRQVICTIALTGGKAQVVAGSDLVTWVDTAVVTSYHSKTITTTDSGTDRIVRVSMDVAGMRYLEGLFTGAGSTAVTATAYIRAY